MNPDLPSVAGDIMIMTHEEFQRACQLHLLLEQEKPLPDNSLVHILCEAVRCSRECCQLGNIVKKIP